ncbi:MAG: hypothetical protein JEZ07_18070 [Phycisphaerae bacterium]|nr:hypothetical protein [Phycisphaerae bacterium]
MKTKILFLIMCLVAVGFANASTIVHYDFQEKAPGFSAEVDDVINNIVAGHDGVVTGEALEYVNGPDGLTALQFEADSGIDRIEIAPSDDFVFDSATDSFTIEAIINIGTSTDIMGIISGDTGGGNPQWWWRTTGGKLQFLLAGTGSSTEFGYTTTVAINDGNWHRIAVVYDATAKKFTQFIDGVDNGFKDTTALSGNIGSPAAVISIGEFNTSTNRDLAGAIAAVRISDVTLVPAEFLAMTPIGANDYSPMNGIEDVDTAETLTFSWLSGQDPNAPGTVNPFITGHNVYLGTDPQAMELKTATPLALGITTFDIAGLVKDTEYFWRIDEVLSGGSVIFGHLYSFNTELTLPQIDSEPVDVKAWPGDDATLAFIASDPLGGQLSYQWYIDPNSNITGDESTVGDGEKYAGALTDTLTVKSVELADTYAVYYCKVSNSASINTNSVSIGFKHIFAHWRLNETEGTTATDDSGNGYDGALIGDPQWVEGQIDNALKLDGSGDAALLVEHAMDFTQLSEGTVSLWANIYGTGAYSLLAISDDTVGSRELRFFIENNSLFLGARGANFDGSTPSLVGYADQQWHLITFTHDADNLTTVYVDGLAKTSAITPWFDDFPAGSLNHMAIGCNKDSGGLQWFLNGIVDDIRIYDFPLSPTEVADLYVAVEDPICVAIPQGDFNGDCVVSLEDFALFTSEWMQCNWVPASVCP